MTRDELLARLNSIEWTDIEFKEAAWEVPKNAFSTVSAFANTAGGHLVFGVKEQNGTFTVSGVINADKVQNDFPGPRFATTTKSASSSPSTASFTPLMKARLSFSMCRKHSETRSRCTWTEIPGKPMSVAAAETTPAPATS